MSQPSRPIRHDPIDPGTTWTIDVEMNLEIARCVNDQLYYETHGKVQSLAWTKKPGKKSGLVEEFLLTVENCITVYRLKAKTCDCQGTYFVLATPHAGLAVFATCEYGRPKTVADARQLQGTQNKTGQVHQNIQIWFRYSHGNARVKNCHRVFFNINRTNSHMSVTSKNMQIHLS